MAALLANKEVVLADKMSVSISKTAAKGEKMAKNSIFGYSSQRMCLKGHFFRMIAF
jgi:hypothetical protein